MASKVYKLSISAAALGSVLVLVRPALAQAAAAPAAAPPPPASGQAPPGPAAPACIPPCRAGYFCHQGSCVSMCNPPCPPNQVCIDGTRCDFPPPLMAPQPPGIYEPPPPAKKPFDERTHSMLAFHLGFGGDVEADSGESGLDPTLGLNLRVDIPVARYVLTRTLVSIRQRGGPTCPVKRRAATTISTSICSFAGAFRSRPTRRVSGLGRRADRSYPELPRRRNRANAVRLRSRLEHRRAVRRVRFTSRKSSACSPRSAGCSTR